MGYGAGRGGGSRKGPIVMEASSLASLQELFEMLPQAYQKKVLISVFRKGASPMRSALKRSLPSGLKPTAKALKVKAGRSKDFPNLSVGFFGNVLKHTNRRGKQWDAFMLIYWANYGTYGGRSYSHRFQKARKKKTAGYTGGIKGKLFVESAIEGTHKAAQNKVEEAFDQILDDFLSKHRV